MTRIPLIQTAPQNWRERLAELLFSNRSRPLDEKDWPQLFQGAGHWSVIPQVAAVARRRSFEGPVAGWPDFKRVSVATQARSAMRAAKGLEALRHLSDAGVPALAFKGLASMASLYVTPVDRTIADTDVLVVPEQVPDALATLKELGFQPAAGQEFLKIEKFLDKSPGFAGNKAISLYGPQRAEIDLHWSVGLSGIPPQRMLERSEKAVLFGSEIRVPSAADAIVLTARHSVRENFTVDKMCRDLLDIRLWCDKLAASDGLSTVLDSIHRSGHAVPVLAATEILAGYDGNSACAQAAQALDRLASTKERNAGRELTRMFFAQLRNGPLSKDLFYLAHSKPIRQIFGGACANWREYRGVMRSLEERLEGEEVALFKRIQLLVTALVGVNLREFRSMRTLARLKYNN